MNLGALPLVMALMDRKITISKWLVLAITVIPGGIRGDLLLTQNRKIYVLAESDFQHCW